MKAKTCTVCKQEKPLAAFGRDISTKSGYTHSCKDCRNLRQRQLSKEKGYYEKRNEKHKDYRAQYYKRPEVLDRLREKWFQKNYGISLEEYNALLESQERKCAVCKTLSGETKASRLVVDHCHETGRIRGLLCQNCNRGLGLLKDSPSILSSAMSYLSNQEKTHE